MLFGGDRYKVLKQIGNCLPGNALNRLKVNPDPAVYHALGKYSATIPTAWIVLAAWALTAGLTTLVVVDRRDV